jgi:hypothetical protein
MPHYRLIFPTPPDVSIEQAHTAHIESETFLEVGDEVEHHGKRWRVSQAPVEESDDETVRDLMVWPAE